MEISISISKFFFLWKENTKRRIWEQLRQEEIDEENYACESGMDPIYWCWKCKYGDCETH